MKFKLEFTEKELNIVLLSLQKQPHELVDELFHNIVRQIQLQQAQAQVEKAVVE